MARPRKQKSDRIQVPRPGYARSDESNAADRPRALWRGETRGLRVNLKGGKALEIKMRTGKALSYNPDGFLSSAALGELLIVRWRCIENVLKRCL